MSRVIEATTTQQFMSDLVGPEGEKLQILPYDPIAVKKSVQDTLQLGESRWYHPEHGEVVVVFFEGLITIPHAVFVYIQGWHRQETAMVYDYYADYVTG